VRYRGLDDDVVVSDAYDATSSIVRPEQETFAVSPVEPRVDEDGAGGNETGSDGNGTDEGDNRTAAVAGAATGIAPGETARYDVVVRNTGSEPVSDVQAKLFVDEPISSDDDEAFVTSLDPGEETTLRFEVSADGGAAPKTYSAAVDFRYDDAEGDEQLSDTYRPRRGRHRRRWQRAPVTGRNRRPAERPCDRRRGGLEARPGEPSDLAVPAGPATGSAATGRCRE